MIYSIAGETSNRITIDRTSQSSRKTLGEYSLRLGDESLRVYLTQKDLETLRYEIDRISMTE